MRSKLKDIFEVSRMMLPEHKEQIIKQNVDLKYPPKERPSLDEQEWQIINEAIGRSHLQRESIKLRMYDRHEELIVEGIVERVNMVLEQIRVDGEWFNFKDIIGVL